jgi:hypothetical protein
MKFDREKKSSQYSKDKRCIEEEKNSFKVPSTSPKKLNGSLSPNQQNIELSSQNKMGGKIQANYQVSKHEADIV